jgi:hypothetical protein
MVTRTLTAAIRAFQSCVILPGCPARLPNRSTPHPYPVAMPDQEHEWLGRMQRALTTARQWETWAEDLHLPRRRSALHYDDRLCVTFPTSTSAYPASQPPSTHKSHRRRYPGKAGDPALRLLPTSSRRDFAAARSVWILSPSYRKHRQSRALWMEWDNNRKHRAFVESVRTTEPEAEAARDGVLATLRRFHQMIIEAAESIGHHLSNRNNPPSDTHIMETATAWLDRHEHPNELGSGHAAMMPLTPARTRRALVAMDQHWQGRVTRAACRGRLPGVGGARKLNSFGGEK